MANALFAYAWQSCPVDRSPPRRREPFMPPLLRPLWVVILASWGIAFFEYCLAVPANRWGSSVYSAAELKAMQEVITLAVFVVFSFFYLGQRITAVQSLGFALIAGGAFLVFRGAPQVST
jgi:uncharacterized protein (DUF486 family)